MPSGSIQSTISVGGVMSQSNVQRTADGQIGHQMTLPAGKTGSLKTRTDDDTGVATLEADHGVTTDDTVDVYWTGGMRYGMSVTVVDVNDVTIDLGAGDNLPAAETALVVTPRIEVDTDFDGDLAEMVFAHCSKRAHVEFLKEDDTSILARELGANAAWTWIADQGIANPLTGDPVGKLQVTCGEAVAATLSVGILYDSVP